MPGVDHQASVAGQLLDSAERADQQLSRARGRRLQDEQSFSRKKRLEPAETGVEIDVRRGRDE